jgi:replicative DNA helicase
VHFEIANGHFEPKTTGMKDMKDALMKAIGDIQKRHDRPGTLTGLSTGFKALDSLTDGLHGGELFVIAGEPSAGKTALAMNMAEDIAVNKGGAVAFFTPGMNCQQLVPRFLCSVAHVNLANVRQGSLSECNFPALVAAAAKLAAAKVFIDDTSGLSIIKLSENARCMKSQHNIQAIFIDYLELVRSTSSRACSDREEEIAEITAALKALAMELNVPIVVLAQLNRNPDARSVDGKGRPHTSDLPRCGSIEQHADILALLVREESTTETGQQNEDAGEKATLIIAKQRNGPIGEVPLTFRKEYSRFATAAA